MTDLEIRISSVADEVGLRLDSLTADGNPESALVKSVRYSLLAGGKRIRPFLAVSFCEALGGNREAAVTFACALEMVHTYSLIHDDLPCMDNDTLRRGKPTNHVVFGEATALLAGDALLTRAFGVAAEADIDNESRIAAIRLISEYAGYNGMALGQQIDLESEEKAIGFKTLLRMHSLKTGALISAACLLGVCAAGKLCDEGVKNSAIEYANGVGLAFQIVDDILDATKPQSVTGKTSSDAVNGKETFLSFMSIDDAFNYATDITAKACVAVRDYDRDGILHDTAKYLLTRVK